MRRWKARAVPSMMNSSTTYPSCTGNVVSERLEVLFAELAELAGQRKDGSVFPAEISDVEEMK